MNEDIVHMNMICLKFQHSLQRVSKSLDLEFELINSYEEKSVSTEDLRKRRAREGPSLSHMYMLPPTVLTYCYKCYKKTSIYIYERLRITKESTSMDRLLIKV